MTTQNSCRWSFDNVWRHLNIDTSGVATPNPVAPGSGVTLTQTSVHAQLPDYLAEYGYNLGILKAGDNAIQARVWVAIEAAGTVQGVQVQDLETVAHTTITVDSGGNYQTSTPIDVTVPLADSAWTPNSGAANFRQGSVGTLPQVEAGTGGVKVKPLGSVMIRATIGTLSMNIDCQPGSGEGAAPPVPRVADAFDTVRLADGAPAIPAPKATPVIALRSASLSGRTLRAVVTCTGAPCEGTLRASTRKALCTLAPGKQKTLKLTLKKRYTKVSLRLSVIGGKTLSKTVKAPKKKKAKARPWRARVSSRSSGTPSRTCTCSGWRRWAPPT